MKTKLNKLSAFVLALALVISMSLTAYAHDVPQMDRLGSITVTMRSGETGVAGGTLTIYRVGEVVEHDGNYSFIPTGDFADCGESFEKLDSASEIAARLTAYAATESAAGLATKSIGKDGKVQFSDLEVGLYLIVQHEAAPGYNAIAPFLVSLPYMEDGTYRYDLDAVPKTALKQELKPTDPPPTKPSPTKPSPNLPQTGQLWWPVPVLACGGLALFSIGLALNRRREADEN